MKAHTRKILDKSFTGMGFMSVILLTLSLVIVLGPIFVRGIQAFLFFDTVEYRRMQLDLFDRGDPEEVKAELDEVWAERRFIYDTIAAFEEQVENEEIENSWEYPEKIDSLNDSLKALFGPRPDEPEPVLPRDRYGETRWDRAQQTFKLVMYKEQWDYSDPSAMGSKVLVPRIDSFRGTTVEQIFPYMEENLEKLMLPEFTFYWQFLTDKSHDIHFFGGIGAEVLGTFYLVIGTMLFAIPIGVIAAIYLAEFAKEGKIVSLLRTAISTLAGVPSIVFGLFGLAFFINTMEVSQSKSVLAGSLTLTLLVLPTIIRAAEEAILAVPKAYKEASLSLGASKLYTILKVILPAAMPGILTGIVISMGRAAGETAPIIFTAAVSVGQPLGLFETLNQPTMALPWNIYNLVTEHEAVDQIRHVQFGMVFTLVLLVVVLNFAAIVLRARISKKLRG
ncbi:MAG: phosphate ABC transporter permease PstA [Acidobacteria bacterium]|nr:phosphate ABC transporter permease PstA [Acidobacteriota bacterium]